MGRHQKRRVILFIAAWCRVREKKRKRGIMELEGGGVGSGTSSNSCLMMGYGENVNSTGTMMPLPFITCSSSLFPPNPNNNTDSGASMKAKIMSHPHYPRLLAAYINCHKIGAPPEVLAKLEECYTYGEGMHQGSLLKSNIGEDPALDQFMEAYCEMLNKYEQELSRPFKEAMSFFSRIEYQVKALTFSSSSNPAGSHEVADLNRLSEGDISGNEVYIDPRAEDQDLKMKLLRKYSGYLGGLKQEFMKKKKKGKLPKEARQQLMDWWMSHHKWPYPSEPQKLALAESTGLDQKQINNWFINQRKRHWKPSEDMQFAVMEGMHPHYYMNTILNNPFPLDCSPSLL